MPTDGVNDGAAEVGRATHRREEERRRIGDRPHVDGITRGTVVEYDDWQWAVITEIDEDHEPSIKAGFVLLDELGDDVTDDLEDAWGCAEHYDAVEKFRGGEHEYWTDIDYIAEDDIWTVLGPVHPDERDDEPELVTDGGKEVGRATPRLGRGQLVQRKKTGCYWHVVNRFVDVDTGRVHYRIANPSHSQDLRYREEDVHADFENTGIRFSVGMKPASVFGERVDGILRGKNEVIR